MFALLHQAIEQDVKDINTIRKFSEDTGFEVSSNREGDAFTVKRAQAIKPVVTFAVERHTITVTEISHNGSDKQEYRISLCDDGRCKLTHHGAPLEQWQVRKYALERLFFPAHPAFQ
jgi:hypothetical protein